MGALRRRLRKAAGGGKDMLTTEKLMQTFRMPRELVAALRAEANRKGLDLTALVVKLTHGYLTDFGLPEAATTLLDQDREALGIDRDAYLLHLALPAEPGGPRGGAGLNPQEAVRGPAWPTGRRRAECLGRPRARTSPGG